MRSLIGFLLIVLAFIPIWQWAQFYPMGGWDAWATWNFKAKFLLTAGDQWKNVFEPVLWRSSPHYPLLLPSINIWGWSLLPTPEASVPLFSSFLFTFLTAGLLFSSLRQKKSALLCALAVLLMISLTFFIKLAASQYADIVVAYYFLAALVCLHLSKSSQEPALALAAGLFLGCLTFSKSEGTMAGMIVLVVGTFYLYERPLAFRLQNPLKSFWLGMILGVLPTIIFTLWVAPPNQTFYNGLTSADHPATLFRLKMILAFLYKEFLNEKWNGLWLIFFVLLLMNGRKSWNQTVRFIPIVLGIYLTAVGFYYYLNTYFEIGWWLMVSLNRILFAMLPAIFYWVFYSLEESSTSASLKNNFNVQS